MGALVRLDVIPVEICAVHETIEGIVYLWVGEGAENCWIARIKGCEVDSGHIADSHLDAVRQKQYDLSKHVP